MTPSFLSGRTIRAWVVLRLWTWITYWAALAESLVGLMTLTAVPTGGLTLRCVQRVALARQRLYSLLEVSRDQ